MSDTAAGRTPTPVDHIAEEWVKTLSALCPEIATYIGATAKLDEYSDYSPAGRAELMSAATRTLAALDVATPVDDTDRVTITDLSAELRLDIELEEAGWGARDINVLASPAQGIREIYDLMPTATEDDWSIIARRLGRVDGALDGSAETLREGIANGNTPAVRQVREVLAQVRTIAARDGFFAEFTGGAEVSQSLKNDYRRRRARRRRLRPLRRLPRDGARPRGAR